jgi:DNA-binding IscR family transcriptional regulator
VTGGYSLARPGSEINLRDVVELLEGVELERCSLSLEGSCATQGRCTIQNRLRELEEGYLKSMENLSIAALSEEIVTDPIDVPAESVIESGASVERASE